MYNKLFTKILDSSIWLEPTSTRIVWMTFLAAMDEDGFAQFASVANLAHRARVTLEEALEAVQTLQSPDHDSSDEDNQGRRIERVPGGWMILNAAKYRDMVTKVVAREKARLRVSRFRAAKASNAAPLHVTPSEAEAEAEAGNTYAPAARRSNPRSAKVSQGHQAPSRAAEESDSGARAQSDSAESDSGVKSSGAALPVTPKPPRPRDVLFDAIATECGINLGEINKVTGGMVAKAKQLVLQSSPEVTPDEIRRRCQAYARKWPGITLTPTALAKHWPVLGAASAESKTYQFDAAGM